MKSKKLLTERQEIIRFVRWGSLIDEVIIHFSNEGARSLRTGAILKKMGLRSGFPDCGLLRSSLKYHGAFIEMKQNRIYRPSEKTTTLWLNQQWWLDYLNSRGYYAIRAYGWKDAVEHLQQYYFIKN
jgi:hypothetical protein